PRRDATKQIILETLEGVQVWLAEFSAVTRALFLPTGLLDSLPLDEVPDDPPPGRIRSFFLNELGTIRWKFKDAAGTVINAVPSLIRELLDVENTVVPDRGAVLAGDGVAPAEDARFRQVTAPLGLDGWGLISQFTDAHPTGLRFFPVIPPLFIGDFFLGQNFIIYLGESSVPDDEIQYTRVQLPEGEVINDMQTFFTTFTGGNADVNMGLYDQVDPLSETEDPNDLVASTGAASMSGTGEYTDALSTPFAVPANGFYWVALVVNVAGGLKRIASTPVIPADVFPVRYEVGAGAAALPATAGGLTNPGGPVRFCAAKE
ncbi:hypothetical protein LCGC14_2526650, partial [marine sediment metagenome]